jgi:hypothetical protein
MEHINIIKSTYKKIELLDWLEDAVNEIQSILWFKKIIAFSWWWNWIKVDFDDEIISKKISEYWQLAKEKIVRDIMSRLRDYDVAILTGWTKWDIPNIATTIAREYNIPTIWIFPKRGEKYSIWKDFLNLEIVVDSQYWDSHFWDESSMFAKMADWMFVIWWWAWTLIEFAHVMKINEALKKYNWFVKKIVPISWIPWVSETLHYIPWNEDIKNITFPNINISSWKEAFEWLRKELDLDDILKEYY